MKLKWVVVALLAISALFYGIASRDISASATQLLHLAPWERGGGVLSIVAAVLLQIAGHVVRSVRMQYLLRPATTTSLRFQFRALTIGYLCNAAFPLRLGELVRALILARGRRISLGVTLLALVIERIIDAAIICAVLIILVSVGGITPAAWWYIGGFGVIVGVAAGVIALLASENRTVLKAVYALSNLLNPRLRVLTQFRAWSIIHGLQGMLQPRRVGTSVLLALASWVCYFGGLVVLLYGLVPTWGDLISQSVVPYASLSIHIGPGGLGVYGATAQQLLPGLTDEARWLSWIVLTVPVSLLGLAGLVWKTDEPLRRRLSSSGSYEHLSNKLARRVDVSEGMKGFLESYFSGNQLTRIIHRLEKSGELTILRFFKGGSDAQTTLVKNRAGDVVVQKFIISSLEHRLKAQYDWLVQTRDHAVVQALTEKRAGDHYAIEISYQPSHVMFFDFIHTNPVPASALVLDQVWETLMSRVHQHRTTVSDESVLRRFVDTHIFGCLDKAIAANGSLASAVVSDRIVINGEEYTNIYPLVERILSSPAMVRELSTFSRSDRVHGDVSVDNILVKEDGSPLLIDPAPDGNLIEGPVFDFGKNLQSFYCGYEFIFRSGQNVTLSGGPLPTINFADQRTFQYRELCDYILTDLAPRYLSEGERRSLLFHAGALLIRRLKHQVYQEPGLTLAMYGAGVRALNAFVAQYSDE